MTWSDWIPPIFYKASAVTRQLVLLVGLGHPVWTSKNYRQLAKEGYEANVTVYRCVNEISKAVGSLTWNLFQRPRSRGANVIELETHPLLDLLARPNPWEGGGFFFEKWTGYLMLSGNSYLEAVGPTTRTAPPRELYALRPDRMTVLPDATERVGGYRWEEGGRRVDFKAEQIHHMKLFHPTDDWYGLSPIEVAARVIDTDNVALTWNFRLLQNSARPSGALTVQGNLADAQFTRLQTQIKEEYTGAERAGFPMLLEGGMDWKEMSLSPQDLDFLNGRKMSQLQIAMAYGVPPELIGLKEGTFENRRESRKAFYSETILPLADRAVDELNNWLVPRFGDRLRLNYDRDAIDALGEDREKVWTRIQNAMHLTINEKRAATGYDEHPDGDVLLVPFSVVPLGEAGSTGPSFEQVEAEAEEDEGAERGGAAPFPRLNRHDPDTVLRASVGNSSLPFNEQRTRQWKAKVLEFAPIERQYLAALRRYFHEQQDEVLRRLMDSAFSTQHSALAMETKDIEEILFVLDAETDRLREVSRPHFQRALRQGGQAVWVEVGAIGAFGEEAPSAVTRLRVQLDRVGSIARTARERVRRAIEAGLNAPGGAEGVAQIASRIREVYARLSAGQALTIARTETARAYNEGRDEAMTQSGVEETEWLTARDESVRDSHLIDGETRRRGEPFSNGLRYPNDPLGAPGETINCRCVAIPVVRR